MRVLHVNDYERRGGCEVSVATTTRLLGERGIDVEVITGDDLPQGPLAYIDSRVARRRLARRISEWRPDVVHLHNFYHRWSPGILATLAGFRRTERLRVLMTAHDFHIVCPNSGLRSFRRGQVEPVEVARLGDRSYLWSRRWDHRGPLHSGLKLAQHVWNYRVRHRTRAIDAIICPSRFMQSILDECGLPTVYVPNPAPQPAATGGVRPAGSMRMIFAGRLDPEKGLAPFLRALPSGLDLHLEVVGDGTARAEIESIIAERGLGDRVTLAGRLSHARTIAMIGEAHLCVLPSLVDENAPIVLLEALALGTNILVADRGGMREVVKTSGVGYTIETEDPDSVRRTLVEVVAAHRAGRLNDFDVTRYLDDHREAVYVERLIALYDVREH